jgi:hypothetical protein
MSKQTDKKPDPQVPTGNVIPPAVPGGTPVDSGVTPANVASDPPVDDPHDARVVVRPRGKEDWIELHEELPRPTYWPIVMAVAITLIAFGIVNALLIIIIGFVLLVVALIGWIGDVRDEARLRHH